MSVCMCLCRCAKAGGRTGGLHGGDLAPLQLLLPSPWRLQELSEDLSMETEGELRCLSLSLALPPLPILCLQR